MAGHSHWANIQRTKGAADKKRGKLFSKLSKEIQMAARLGGGHPEFNPRLRTAIDAARSQSMPNDNIDRAIKKGTGELGGTQMEEFVYEGYGAGGVAFVVECMSDNKNRTAADVRMFFSKYGGNLGGAGSVAWMFHKKGRFVIPASSATEESLMECALDAGAEDIRAAGEFFEVICPLESFDAVKSALASGKIAPESARLEFIPENLTPVTDAQIARQVLALYEALEDCEDVQNVYANFDMAEDMLAP
ncbi:YebC/PmpR family DNA-binding transcriptional regulator [Oscillatoria laete-virens NRMC-F 0139]|nr:YebC/PmpR family DNA-binding transcriptional regulator [Oscillatoria laete-virens]MDL5055773.1 YebC/PmpR family DNA-binding transcriptional regulator [Oscillatoria laete-virens NRMC-F 0139]